MYVMRNLTDAVSILVIASTFVGGILWLSKIYSVSKANAQSINVIEQRRYQELEFQRNIISKLSGLEAKIDIILEDKKHKER